MRRTNNRAQDYRANLRPQMIATTRSAGETHIDNTRLPECRIKREVLAGRRGDFPYMGGLTLHLLREAND